MNLSKREKEYLTLVYTGAIGIIKTVDYTTSNQFACNAIRDMEWDFDVCKKYPDMKGIAINTFLSNKPTKIRRFPKFYSHKAFTGTFVWWNPLDGEVTKEESREQRLLFLQALIDKING